MNKARSKPKAEGSRAYAGGGIKGRGKITDEIIAVLLHDVASGRLAPGDRLPNEAGLASHFGVSQPTIREAIRVLDAMGLIEVRHGSGAFVTGDTTRLVSISLETLLQVEQVSILDVSEIRGVLGRQSASRAVEHATDEEIDRLDELAKSLENAHTFTDPQQIVETVATFQTALSAASHNPLLYALETFLIRLLMQFQLRAKMKRGIVFWRQWTLEFAADRRRVVDALRSRDHAATVEAMNTYLTDIRARFASDPELARIRLSDPKSLQTMANVVLEVPDFRSERPSDVGGKSSLRRTTTRRT
jgi:GntR family transcriptional repressor for pyruvate dehydrogenase complex